MFKKFNRSTFILLLLIILVQSSSVFAHSGRTDSSGGHNDRINGGYHYHNTGNTTKTAKPVATPKPVAKPKPIVTPKPVATPKPIVTPKPVVTPKPAVIPEPAVISEPVVIPEPTVIPEPISTPEPVVIPKPISTLEPVVLPDPIVTPEPVVIPESIAKPTTVPVEYLISGIRLFVNDSEILLANKILIRNGLSLVPLREVSEALELKVAYIPESKSIIVENSNTKVVLVINNLVATINNKPVNIELAPTIINDVTYIPIRFLVDSFDKKIEWNETDKIIKIFK